MSEKDLSVKYGEKFSTLSNLVIKTLLIFLWLTFIIMIILFIIGFIRLGYGTFLEINDIKSSQGEGVIKILVGIEILFIAPISHLLLLSIFKYLWATKPEINPNLDNKMKYTKHAMIEIGNVKLYVTGLLISILLVHSMKLIFQDEMSFLLCICIIFILITLILYYYILHKTGDHK